MQLQCMLQCSYSGLKSATYLCIFLVYDCNDILGGCTTSIRMAHIFSHTVRIYEPYECLL